MATSNPFAKSANPFASNSGSPFARPSDDLFAPDAPPPADFDDGSDDDGFEQDADQIPARRKTQAPETRVTLYDGAASMVNQASGLYQMIVRLDNLSVYNEWGRGSGSLVHADDHTVMSKEVDKDVVQDADADTSAGMNAVGNAVGGADTDKGASSEWAKSFMSKLNERIQQKGVIKTEGNAENNAGDTVTAVSTEVNTEADEEIDIFERLLNEAEQESEAKARAKELERKQKTISLTGNALVGLLEGNLYEVIGKPRSHPTYGESFDVISARVICEVSKEAIARYLSRNYQGIGSVLANRFIDRTLEEGRAAGKSDYAILEDIRTTAVERPFDLDLSIINKRALPAFAGMDAILEEDEEEEGLSDHEAKEKRLTQQRINLVTYVHRDFQSRIGALGLGDAVLKAVASAVVDNLSSEEANRLIKVDRMPAFDARMKAMTLSSEALTHAWNHLASNPYAYCNDVPGYGFLRADKIGKHLSIPNQDMRRLTALSYHTLKTGCESQGHVFMSKSQFKAACVAQDSSVGQYFDEMVKAGTEAGFIVADDSLGDVRYYLPEALDAECSLAERLVGMLTEESKPMFSGTYDKAVEEVGRATLACGGALAQNGLDEIQTATLAKIITSKTRVHCVTAGPGCGKTALMEVLSKILEDKDVLFCGPTGKSAKVLNNRVSDQGRFASTIHSMLMGSGRGDFLHTEKNPISGDVLVSDETSMNDNELADSLLAAVPKNMHIVFLGDDHQLPSVGMGRVLKDLLLLDDIDHHRLTRTYRNSGGILDVVKELQAGTIDIRDRESVQFKTDFDHKSKSSIVRVLEDYSSSIAKYGMEGSVLLMSRRQGNVDEPDFNTTYFNAVLRDKFNPHALKVPGSKLFIGDRILVRANTTAEVIGGRDGHNSWSSGDKDETRVVNGDTGFVVSYRTQEEARAEDSGESTPQRPRSNMIRTQEKGAHDLVLQLDDGRMVRMKAADIPTIDHGYAMTVHSAQGSEYRNVMSVVTPGNANFMNNAMMFTGVSRAKENLQIYGSAEVIKRVAATPLPDRNSSLVERICNAMEKPLPKEVVAANHRRSDLDNSVVVSNPFRNRQRAR